MNAMQGCDVENAMNGTCDETRCGHEWYTAEANVHPKSVTVPPTRGVGCITGQLGGKSSAPWHRHARDAA